MLATCVVAYGRLELTKRCIGSYLDTVTVPYTLVVVDNAADDMLADWLLSATPAFLIRSKVNLYPGRACNHGWEIALRLAPDVTHLHRSDNDVEYLPGWADEVAARFDAEPRLGQLGLLQERFEEGAPNVGGNSVIRRDVWEAGVRWDETPWQPGVQEDGRMSAAVQAAGYQVGRVERECVRHLGWDFDAYPAYYRATSETRGLDETWLRGHFDRMRAL